jgi:glycolate oxidase FAD binding subunit
MKLHTGALGTLGVITQVTLRLRPVPEAYGATAIPFTNGARLPAVLEAMATTKTRPVSIVAYQRNGRGEGWPSGPAEARWSWSLMVYFEGAAEAVRWQEEQARSELGAVDDTAVVMPPSCAKIEDSPGNARQLLRLNVRPSAVAELALFAGGLSEVVGIVAYAGSGVIEVMPYNTPGSPEWDVAEAKRVFDQLLYKAGDDGNVVLQRGPRAWKSKIPVWGRPPADIALQKAVKRALDSNNLFNPGRFVTDAF